MPVLVRKFLIVAAADGLLLHPQHPRGQKTVQLGYGSNNPPLTTYQAEIPKEANTLEAHGVVGLFTVSRSSFLISITGRKQVAQVKGKSIYVITGVAIIPLSSQAEAARAIENARRKENKPEDDTSDSSDDELPQATGNEEIRTPAADIERSISNESHEQRPRSNSSVVEDVISRKGKYGRFSDRWFSRAGWRKDTRRVQAVNEEESDANTLKGEASITKPLDTDVAATKESVSANASIPLLPKLLRTTKMLFSSRSFFYSYDMDITRRLGTQEQDNDLPLHTKVDVSFFWNKHLLSPFMEQNRGHTFALPIIQGFIGQKAFSVNTKSNSIANVREDAGEVIELQENASASTTFQAALGAKDFLITLISRRSVKRPGLRYLRRGVDEDGNVANYVETEQILSDPAWSPASTTYSFTQIRGSIPLYFSQSPYSLKPVPLIHHSPEMNAAALKKHFEKVTAEYGNVQVACLIDKHGTEVKVGNAFQEHTEDYNKSNPTVPVGWNWFDFHTACRGMKFENVSILLDETAEKLTEFGITTERDGKIRNRQKGVLRVNCMDCLDRTNVVESATASRALEQQLSQEGIDINMQADMSTSWFNSLWADNGDAISKQYSSTAALKGDFTRTRKRDYRGALNDFGLTLSRYYNNIVNDYFSQTTIDFMLGNVGDDVFDEFEQNMQTSDPAELLSMRRIRQTAIDNSSKIVIADEKEDLIAGWTLLTPRTPNTVKPTGPGLEEIVLLLTDTALYAVRLDWTTEKVAGFERVDLKNITSITRGTYITSVLTSSQVDSNRNVGFLIRYKAGEQDDKKINTRSMSTAAVPKLNDFASDSKEGEEVEGERQQRKAEQENIDAESEQPVEAEKRTASDEYILAFKALNSKALGEVSDGSTTPVMSETNMIKEVVDNIVRLTKVQVEEADVVSLAEAKRATGLLEQWGHQLKMLVWGS